MTAIAQARTYEAACSSGQRLLWFMDHYRGEDGALNCPAVLRLSGPLDRGWLVSTLNAIVARHEILRTTFRGRGRALQQVIQGVMEVQLCEVDLRAEVDPQHALQPLLTAELRTRIDPTVCAFRATLWQLRADEHVFCFNMHHLVTDGPSYDIFVRELHQLYDAHATGGSMSVMPGQYVDFVRWEEQFVGSEQFNRHLGYWEAQLRGARMPMLPFAPRSESTPRVRCTHARALSPGVVLRLRDLARARQTTIFAVLLGLFYTLLYRLTGQRDLAVSSVFANRHAAEIRNTMGFVANLLVLRTRIPNAASFLDVLRSTHLTVTEAFTHQALSYYMLPASTNQSGQLRVDELVFQMTQPLYSGPMGKVRAETLPVEGVGNRFDFELSVIADGECLTPVVSYNAARVEARWVEAFLDQYVTYALQLGSNPNLRLATLQLDPQLQRPARPAESAPASI